MIFVIGLGPGDCDLLTPLASKQIAKADWVVGSERQLALVHHQHAQIHPLDKNLSDLIVWLRQHQHENIAVLASGDPMLYGIGKLINEQIKDQDISIVPGISSVQYLLAKVGLDMNDFYLTSSHGKTPDFNFLLQHKKISLMTDKNMGPFQIAQEIVTRKMARIMIIGEMLSYPNEKITILPATEVIEREYQMNVVVVIDER